MLRRVKVVKNKDDEIVLGPAFTAVSVAIFLGAYALRPYLGAGPPADRVGETAHQLSMFLERVFVLPFVWVILVVFPLSWLMVGAHWASRFGQFLLARVELKGALLAIGTLLFLAAKGVVAVYLIGWSSE
jgi:hypothetical protein